MFVSIFAYGQSDTTIKSPTKILLKWTPTALTVGYPALQFAGELYYCSNQSIQIEYGLIFPNISRMTMGRTNLNGHRIRLEHRNYIGNNQRFYLAPELHFIFATYDTKQRFSQNWATDSVTGVRYALDSYLDNVRIKKYAMSGNFKIGFQYIFQKPKLLFDIYFGLGIRYVITKFTSYPTTGEWVPPKDNWLDGYDYKESNRFAPNGVFGIKIGYQIK
jgi:hypothetical protein